MAKPRVFISSTFFDLKQIRNELDLFIESLGYEPVRNEEGDIAYGNVAALEDYCYKEIKSVDILVAIIGGRFGSESKNGNSSISQMELKTALKEGKQVYVFIEKNVLSEYETYQLNKENDIMKYRYVDDKRIYLFIEEIKALKANNNIKSFDSTSDITKYLKEQFAGLFQSFLEQHTREQEINLIRNLENTAQTLNKLVNFLSEENKDQAEEVNRILMINHHLVETLREKMNIAYNFYIEGLDDMKKLLNSSGFYEQPPVKDINYIPLIFTEWKKSSSRKEYYLKISVHLFDKEKKLKFMKRTDWNDSFVQLTVTDKPDNDDLPF